MSVISKVDTKAFRQALGTFATGVTIVTTHNKLGRDVGITVNSFSSVSLDPPLVLWSIAKSANSRPSFLEAEYFAVHILAADQESLSKQFALSGADKFAGLDLERGLGNVPLLGGCSARFQCRTSFNYHGGDHDILVGEVESFEHSACPSMVFQSGRYAVALERPDSGPGAAKQSGIDSGLGPPSFEYLLGRAFFNMRRGVRDDLTQQGLSEGEYMVLYASSFYGPTPVTQLIDAVGVSGTQMTQADLSSLVDRGLLALDGPAAGGSIRITDTGRDIMLRILAKSKAIESDALQVLDYAEMQVLKHLLRRVAQRTGLPWQKPV